MEMTIDDCIKGLLINKEDDTYVLGNETIDFAIKIMRKYQTMQEVLEKVWNVPSCMLDEAECLGKIMETYRTVRW